MLQLAGYTALIPLGLIKPNILLYRTFYETYSDGTEMSDDDMQGFYKSIRALRDDTL
jgi:hypothetical protein